MKISFFLPICMIIVIPIVSCSSTTSSSKKESSSNYSSEIIIENESTKKDHEEKHLSDEQQLREQEQVEKQRMCFEERHNEIIDNNYIIYNDEESWQRGYAHLLESGDAIYVMEKMPSKVKDTKFTLLHMDNSDIPNLVVEYIIEGSVYLNLIFRYSNGEILYVDSCPTDKYYYSFFYRPYHEDIAFNIGSAMNEGIFTVARHLGDDTKYIYSNLYKNHKDNTLTEEDAKHLDIIMHEERTPVLGESWIEVKPTVFTSITSDEIQKLKSE